VQVLPSSVLSSAGTQPLSPSYSGTEQMKNINQDTQGLLINGSS